MGELDRCFRNYDIELEKVLRVSHDDPRIDEYMRDMKPIIITGTNLVKSAMQWDLEYLSKKLPNTKLKVVTSSDHNFKYCNEKKLATFKYKLNIKTKSTLMTPLELLEKLKTWKKGDERLYLQHVLDNSVTSQLLQQFLQFNWDWAKQKQKTHNWGLLTSNLLLISQEGNVTPCHYDEQENLFAGIKGYKRCIMFSPEQFECLYPYPVNHPHDRQSQIDFENPDYVRFPKFKNAKGMEAIIGPGDVLYLPFYWWHHIESMRNDDYTVSLNFWYQVKNNPVQQYPLKEYQKVAVMRNMELSLMKAFGDEDKVADFLKAMVLGRFTD